MGRKLLNPKPYKHNFCLNDEVLKADKGSRMLIENWRGKWNLGGRHTKLNAKS